MRHEHAYGLPVFEQGILYKRVLTDDKIGMLYQSLKNTDWSIVLMTRDTNILYNNNKYLCSAVLWTNSKHCVILIYEISNCMSTV